jgi:hypothetical protein
MNDILTTFVEHVKTALGSKLRSVVLYGSRAAGENIRKQSDHNILILLDSVASADLAAMGPVMKQWTAAGNPPPLVFSFKLFTASADVFPVEFLEMRDKHKVLFGDDPFPTLTIEDKNLRHQCEYELTGKLLKLRQAYMMHYKDTRQLSAVMAGAITSVLVIFRHVMRLLGTQIPADNVAVIDLISERLSMDASAFHTALALKNGDHRKSSADMRQTFDSFLNSIEKVIAAVDRM